MTGLVFFSTTTVTSIISPKYFIHSWTKNCFNIIIFTVLIFNKKKNKKKFLYSVKFVYILCSLLYISAYCVTNIFIKVPYFIEGILYGIFGAIISLLLLYLLYYLTDYFLSPILNMRNYDFITIIALNFSFGMFLGFLGSSRALSTYVKN